MSKAENLLNSLDAPLYEPIAEHAHDVIDTDGRFIIDPDTRTISPSDGYKLIVIEGDHNSERCTFSLPRYIDNHDMATCNRVKLHYINIGSESGEQYSDTVDMDDFTIDPNNEDLVICTWLISRNATQFAGTISVLLEYQCINNDGSIPYEWQTDVYSGITVKPRINNSTRVALDYSDVLEQWRATINEALAGGGTIFTTGENLELGKDKVLRVKVTNVVEADNTLPVSSAGVHTYVGNIEALLETI